MDNEQKQELTQYVLAQKQSGDPDVSSHRGFACRPPIDPDAKLTEVKAENLYFCLEDRIVYICETEIMLTVKEFDLLVELIQNKNAALYREKLYEKVWGEPYVGDTRTLDSHIQRLRKKLNWDNYIKTVFRVGYRLEDKR